MKQQSESAVTHRHVHGGGGGGGCEGGKSIARNKRRSMPSSTTSNRAALVGTLMMMKPSPDDVGTNLPCWYRQHQQPEGSKDLHKREQLEPENFQYWMEWAAKQAAKMEQHAAYGRIDALPPGDAQRYAVIVEEPKLGRTRHDDLMDDFVDPVVEQHMKLSTKNASPCETVDCPVQSNMQVLLKDDINRSNHKRQHSPVEEWGYSPVEAQRPRFVGPFLQLDVVETMRAYKEEGRKEWVPPLSSGANMPSTASMDDLEGLDLLYITSRVVREQAEILAQIQELHRNRQQEWKQDVGKGPDITDSAILQLDFDESIPSNESPHSWTDINIKHASEKLGLPVDARKNNATDGKMIKSRLPERPLKLDGRTVLFTEERNFRDALQHGEETVALKCVTCAGILLSPAKASELTYCPVCGTLAPTGLLEKV